jgi:hypothetical protein
MGFGGFAGAGVRTVVEAVEAGVRTEARVETGAADEVDAAGGMPVEMRLAAGAWGARGV